MEGIQLQAGESSSSLRCLPPTCASSFGGRLPQTLLHLVVGMILEDTRHHNILECQHFPNTSFKVVNWIQPAFPSPIPVLITALVPHGFYP